MILERDIQQYNAFQKRKIKEQDYEYLKECILDYLECRPFHKNIFSGMLVTSRYFINKAFDDLMHEGKIRVVTQSLKNELRANGVCNLRGYWTYYTSNQNYFKKC